MATENAEVAEPLRAVAYVRMSTDRQVYSTENQMEAIAAYAARRNIAIVRIYKDDGKSGLLLDRRPALKSLLGDVMLGKVDFDCILVYDVSRWGRFQNSDESAHYEFLCKEAGVRVEYCAEEFSNDGSLLSNVMKSLKRAMAAEYSRELSTRSLRLNAVSSQRVFGKEVRQAMASVGCCSTRTDSQRACWRPASASSRWAARLFPRRPDCLSSIPQKQQPARPK